MSELGPYVPEDFDSFWQPFVKEAESLPLKWRRSGTNDWDLDGFKIERVEFESVGGRTLHGWFAFEPGSGVLPGFLWIPPYGRESLRPNEFGTRHGFASLSFNFFGHDAFHKETYRMERGYFSEGAAEPATFVFRTMLQDAIVATRVLRSQAEVDEDRVGSMGMSQGAGISIWLGALYDGIRAVCADMPFLSNVNVTLTKEVHRYPLKELTDFMAKIPLGRERVLNTLSYYDTVNMATRCDKPTHVSLGLRDPACKPPNVRACFDALAGEKRLVEYDWGHDWHPNMVENNRTWLLSRL